MGGGRHAVVFAYTPLITELGEAEDAATVGCESAVSKSKEGDLICSVRECRGDGKADISLSGLGKGGGP